MGSNLQKCCDKCDGFEVNSSFFRPPKSTYNLQSNYPQEYNLSSFKNKHGENVPYSEAMGTIKDKCIIYFHGNGQDIGGSFGMINQLTQWSGITTFGLQYPQYGCYRTKLQNHFSDRIKQDSVEFFDFLQKKKGYQPQNIYIYGRSIGSGPACHLASTVKASVLILLAPISTIRSWVESFQQGKSHLVKEHFDSMAAMKNFQGKLLVIHGEKDTLVQFKHGVALIDEYKKYHNAENCSLISPQGMTHNSFQNQTQIVDPIIKFLNLKKNQRKGSDHDI